MTNVNVTTAAPLPPAESPQVEAAGAKTEPPPPPAPSSPAFHGGSKVYKSGPLFLSSKGIGWTSWKKRWFILTQTSLVFYRSDPNAAPSKTGEVNLTLGGIDLNSSGSVVVKEDKKLITVLFSDGRDGRAFTLKAETLEDLHEWKAALEEALSNAPNAALVTQNSLFKNDQFSSADLSSEQLKDKQSAKSLVIGRPILLALEDIDGTPSFLEKALRFLEEHGVKTEGILRQAADVEDVERRIQEYEKGKTEFSPDEDAHVIADCIKYVLRELPSSPVPASCCKALLEACRTDRSIRVNAMRSAICETFPEPNRILLQRILMMMQTVASHKAVNRMSISAVAACMAPLLLRPLLAGECDLDNDFDVGGDGSVQLLQAAAAANHAQAIVITLLEEYKNIFGDVAMTHEPYTDSEESGSETEEISDDESFDEDDMTEDGSESEEDEDEDEEEEEFEQGSSRSASETGEIKSSEKDLRSHSSSSISPRVDDVPDSVQGTDDDGKMQSDNSEIFGAEPDEASMLKISAELSHGASRSMRRPTNLGRASAKKNLSMESIDLPLEDEAAIQKLESLKTDLKNRISDEVNANSALQDNLELRKRDLYERRLALQKEVARLQEQLQKEIDLRKALEAALRISQLPLSVSSLVDDKMKVELEDVAEAETDVMNLKEKADDLECQINQQREKSSRIGLDISNQINQNANQYKPQEKQMDGGHRSKYESCSDRAGNERDKKRESSSSSNRQQQAVAAQHPSRHSSTSRKSSSRAEGTNSTTSALSKLTHRLNFLKERRSQMASELQNMDGSSRSSSQPSVDNYQDSKGKSSSEKINVDKSRKQEAPPNLERGKSESFPTPEKGSSKFPPRTFSR